MQSTLARLTVSLYAVSMNPAEEELKLVIDMEDIINSLDFQQVYLKVKTRKDSNKWTLGPHVGLVMRSHEDVATSAPTVHRDDDASGGGFLSVTFTRAKCRNADNPLGRVVVRTDIYHMAEQTRMLCIPGSDVEDRQYQLDVTGLSINTGTWKELDRCLGLTSAQLTTGLHTMSENPALEWNNLVSGKESITPHMSLLPVMSRLNLCIVAAPAIVYRGDILVCGHSLEVNAVTDIEEITSKRAISSRPGGMWNASEQRHVVPVEVLLTAGKVSFMLYELMEGPNTELHTLSSKLKHKQAPYVHNKDDSIEDVGYEAGSEEGSVEDVLPVRKKVQPLLFTFPARSHASSSKALNVIPAPTNSLHPFHSTGSSAVSELAEPSSLMEKKKSRYDIRYLIGEVAAISMSTQQLVFQLSGTGQATEVVISVAGLKGNISRVARGQIDRLGGSLGVNCLLATTSYGGVSRPLLNPWSCSLDAGLAWEPWQMENSPPQIQLTAEADCILLDVGPEHLRTLQLIWSEYKPFLDSLQSSTKSEEASYKSPPIDQDQHYRDDLRAGAFQFVDASSGSTREDLPLPYQVVFWQTPPTMAWRYPQPRALTRVDVFPVPFKVADHHRSGRERKDQILCSLQYWSDCHSRYKPYTQFHLSESEMCRLELPVPPHQVALYNHLTSDSTAKSLPPDLKNFSVDQLMPESQFFMSFALDSASLYLCTWASGDASVLEFSSHVRCDVLDYAYLTQHCVVEPFQAKAQLTMGDKRMLRCVTKPVAIRFGPSIGHTLSVSTELWNQAFQSFETRNANPENDYQVTLSGQLVIANLLAEPLECEAVAIADDSGGLKGGGQSLVAVAKSSPPSLLLDANCKMALRIRFHGRSCAWSGDIPLRENTKTGQPWLVKVPFHDRGQFLSVWCHVVRQPIGHREKILAMVCPLYMIRSYLPVPAKVLIDTPGLKVHLQSTVNGRGEEQQLYCPGTLDHSHKLTFQLESGMSPSNPHVPLSYTMIDQRKFFRRDEKDKDIDKILDVIHKPSNLKWPFLGDEYANLTWIADAQPETHVQVKYTPRDQYCSTLVVELQPIPHQGVITPPKLENTFNLALDIGEAIHSSPPLQLARHDWGSSFYMPRISGLIPNNGSIQTTVQCENSIGVLSIASTVFEEMRIVTVRANHVSALAIREFQQCADFQAEDKQKCVLTILPDSEDKNDFGYPLVHWNVLGEKDAEGEFVLYIMLNAGAGWSCPIRVSDGIVRRSFSIPRSSDGSGHCNYACTLTAREHKGQIFLSVYPELHPQIVVHNMCRFKIFCAQGMPENDGSAVPENLHLIWWFSIEPHSSGHYSLPTNSEKFPEILSTSSWPCFVLALADKYSTEDGMLLWSRGVLITETQEQFVRLPGHGDVKVKTEVRCHTTHITVDTVSHVEISARDIRSRLINHQEDITSVVVEKLYLRPMSAPSAPGQSHLSCSSDYLSVSCSSQSQVELYARATGSEMSFMSATDSANTAPPDFSTSKLSTASSSSSLLTITEASNSVDIRKTRSSAPSYINATCFLRGLQITLTDDIPKTNSERTEVILLSLDNVCVSLKPLELGNGSEELNISVSIGDLQLDNQMYQRGGFDFPVILIGQVPKHHAACGFSLSTPSHILEEISGDSLVIINASLEMLNNREYSCTAMKDLNITLGPLCAYVEDTLIMKLYEFLQCVIPSSSMYPFPPKNSVIPSPVSMFVPIPREIYWDSKSIAHPLRLRTLTIQPLSLLLTAHKSLKLYIALNHSPLQFPAFERRHLMTTPYRLGHTLTTHYFFGAIFGAGWMLGSLELLGSPGGFARTLGSGLRDFVSLPYRGIFEGPWGFLVGVTHGSASLMKHVTAGTLSSVTNLAASVARNLDILTLDQEHLARTEELRRQRPQGVTQGLLRGLTGLGISLLGAVGGIAHHSLQSVMSDGPSTRGLVAGVGLGLVGAITKPLSGAAELVALTGQGLLHGTGWTTMPEVRQHPHIEHAFSDTNSRLKYGWKLITGLGAGRNTLLHVTEATCITTAGTYKAVALVLTTQALFLIDTEEDVTRRVLALSELSGMDHPSDPTLLSFRLQAVMETDAVSHSRIVDFVRRSSGMVVEISRGGTPSEAESSIEFENC
ncbi:hypothetical protein C0J52_23169 [Blattella germanica]|nr:hypothetical protein C0J52_23169 [Blattella germanica]